MDNIKSALEYAVELAAPEIYEIGDETFSSKQLYRVDGEKEHLVSPLEITTLTGFIDYIIANVDGLDLSETLIVIDDEACVSLISVPNKDRRREGYMRAVAVVPSHEWGYWTGNEKFIIGLQAMFAESPDRETLMKYVGNIQEDEAVHLMDDGVSQKIATKAGVANVANVILPNPVVLRPYRTFQEIEQVESKFIFRVRKGGECALFEADGGEWTIRCRRAIKDYLKEKLEGVSVVIIG